MSLGRSDFMGAIVGAALIGGSMFGKKRACMRYVMQALDIHGARSRNRTGTPLRAGDFKSHASTSFAIRAVARSTLWTSAWSRYASRGWCSKRGNIYIPSRRSKVASVLFKTKPVVAPKIKKLRKSWIYGAVLKWRPKSESNRRRWICNPLHNHFAIRPQYV